MTRFGQRTKTHNTVTYDRNKFINGTKVGDRGYESILDGTSKIKDTSIDSKGEDSIDTWKSLENMDKAATLDLPKVIPKVKQWLKRENEYESLDLGKHQEVAMEKLDMKKRRYIRK